jgi:aquaporin Z
MRESGRRPTEPAAQPAHAGFHWRIWGAEALGTALLVLGALSAAAALLGEGTRVREVLPSESARLLVTGVLVGGCVSLIAVSPLGRLSGAHINPAVTLAFAALGRVSRHDVAGYLVAQLAGALGGAAAFRLLWGSVAFSIDGGVTHPTVPLPAAFALEAGMTAILLAAIFLFVSHERLARWTPAMLCPLLAVLVWQGSPSTGTSLNPARSEGPAVAFADLDDLWLYLTAPILGALAVALLWRRRPTLRPLTAKLFHDARYPCSLGSELPAMSIPAGDQSTPTL